MRVDALGWLVLILVALTACTPALAGGTAEGAIMREYRVLGVPETLLFSAEGELVDRFTALVNQERLESTIQALLDL